MGKAAACIRMLQILNTGRIYQVSELAKLLDTNPRNIIEYKKELDEISEDAGFYIESIPGKYGGYKLVGNVVFPTIKLTPEDKDCLVNLFNYALAKDDYINKNGCVKTMSKVFSSLVIDEKNNKEIKSTVKVGSYINNSTIAQTYQLIEYALENNTKIENNTQNAFSPVESPKIFGARIFPSICCRIIIKMIKYNPFHGSANKIKMEHGIAPINGPKHRTTFVIPTITLTNMV